LDDIFDKGIKMQLPFIGLILQNFGLAMLIVAIVIIVLNKLLAPQQFLYEIIFRWIILLPLGFTAIYAFIMHAFFGEISAAIIGWHNSPFQFEVAMANLGFGALSILSFKADYHFRLAAVIGNTCWLWGDAIGHIYQMIIQHNFSIGNAGSWFWLDVLMPMIIIICILKLKEQTK
jgi:hypothetical protein